MPLLREAHVRNDGQTREGDWTALCGVVRPATSYSEAHARRVVSGQIAGLSVLTLCPQCEVVLRERMGDAEVATP